MASTISAGTTTTTALVYSADTSGVLQLQTNGTTTAVTIDTNQNVGIGTSSPAVKLDVVGASGSGYFKFKGGATGSGFGSFVNAAGTTIGYLGNGGSGSSNAGTAADFAIRYEANLLFAAGGSSTAAMTLDASGNLTVPAIYTNTTAAVSYVAVSSAGLLQRGGVSALKYKQNIRDIEDFDISLLRPVRYKSKCDGDDQTKDHLGLIADEAAAAGFEELVTYGADGEVEGFQYERLTVVLLKKLQVLESEFKSYKATHP